MKITAEKFKEATGFEPEGDDLERCNCVLGGKPGHFMCGWDHLRDMPKFMQGDKKNPKKIEG